MHTICVFLRPFASECVEEWPEPSMYFGGVHAVEPGRTGAGDARRGGTVRVV